MTQLLFTLSALIASGSFVDKKNPLEVILLSLNHNRMTFLLCNWFSHLVEVLIYCKTFFYVVIIITCPEIEVNKEKTYLVLFLQMQKERIRNNSLCFLLFQTLLFLHSKNE